MGRLKKTNDISLFDDWYNIIGLLLGFVFFLICHIGVITFSKFVFLLLGHLNLEFLIDVMST